MATVKLKFRPSVVKDKEGTLYYQVIHKRAVRQIKTDYHILADEWNEKDSEIICSGDSTTERRNRLAALRECTGRELRQVEDIISRLERSRADYDADDVVSGFLHAEKRQTLFAFMREVISRLLLMGKRRTAETYMSALKSFSAFRGGEDLYPDEVDSDLMQHYEAHLHGLGLVRNTTSFYMRILRAVYNRAVEKGLTAQREPFRHVYTGVDKTVKRAIPLKAVSKIKGLDLSMNPALDYARDMFLFSFYTRGMSFIDMAFLRKKDLQDGTLSYRRHKTGQRLYIRWEKCMQEIIDKYPPGNGVYMLPIITIVGNTDNEIRQYRNALRLVNQKLKTIGRMVGLDAHLTMYVSRHSWASAAKSRHIPVSVISEGMGHDSETTTQIYLASLDTAAVDKANRMILKNL